MNDITKFMNVVSDIVDCPKSIPFEMLNEEYAIYNHSQSLKRLNERGGMSPVEIVANIEHVSFNKLSHDIYDKIFYVNELKKYLQNYEKQKINKKYN